MPKVTITVNDNTPQPYSFPLHCEEVTMGRGSENDIVIACPSVSVRHAVMKRKSGYFSLNDLGSTNGMKVDGVQWSHVRLKDGDTLKLGDVNFAFTLKAEEIEVLEQEKPDIEEELKAPKKELPQIQEIVKEELPKSEKPERSKKTTAAAVSVTSPLQNAMMFVCFFILAALAFYIGLSMRHQKEMGKPLLESITQKNSTGKAPAAPASAEITAPAE